MARAAPSEQSAAQAGPAALLQQLIRFDTTNPPGNEQECISYIERLLRDAGLETTIRARDPERPNLVARLSGRGEAPPLLLYGHVDVVTTAGQAWSQPPFEGRLVDGFIWGRGAVDMKGGVAMMLSALQRIAGDGVTPPGDVIFCALSDEEGFGAYGAGFIVEEHAELFSGVRYALGEFGGFALYLGGRRFYPIQVTEKEICTLRATARGEGGHGAMPVHGGAVARLARALIALDQRRLPVHVTPVARQMCEAIASALPFPQGALMRRLTQPAIADRALRLMGERARRFNPLLRNTASATMLRASDKLNVIPSEASALIDGRLLPGLAPADMIAEVRAILGEKIELELVRHDPGPGEADMGMFDTLASVLRELDPEGVPVPLIMAGVTDGRYFSRLGIQTYGFLPMNLPPDFDFWRTVHGVDERVPASAVEFGAEAIFRALQRFDRDAGGRPR